MPVLSPLASQYRIPLVIGAYDHRIPHAGSYTFGGFVNTELVARNVARFFRNRGAKRIGLVTCADDWSSSFEEPFKDEARKLGLELVYAETLQPSETEMRSVVASLKKKKAEAVLAPLYGNSLLSFIRRSYEMQSGILINVADGMFESDVKSLGKAAEGVTAMQIWVESAELRDKVLQRFGPTLNPLQLGLVASGYDIAKHIFLAAKDIQTHGKGSSEVISGEDLSRALRTFKSVGYLGEHMLGAAPEAPGERLVVVEGGGYHPVAH